MMTYHNCYIIGKQEHSLSYIKLNLTGKNKNTNIQSNLY